MTVLGFAVHLELRRAELVLLYGSELANQAIANALRDFRAAEAAKAKG